MKNSLLFFLLVASSICFGQGADPFRPYQKVKASEMTQQDEKLKFYVQKERFYSKLTSGLVLATASANILFLTTDLDRQVQAGFVLPVSGLFSVYSYTRKRNYKRKALLRYAKLTKP